MVPAIRALADRFIYDTATLKYVARGLPDGAADRVTAGSGWTVRQLLAHLAVHQQRDAQRIRQWLEDPARADTGGDPTERNARMANGNRAIPMTDVAAAFDAGIRDLVAACDAVDERRLTRPFGPYPFIDAMTFWSGHAHDHAVDLVSALPEFKTDPIVLNWVLHFDFSDRPEWSGWQLDLIAEVREIFELQGAEP